MQMCLFTVYIPLILLTVMCKYVISHRKTHLTLHQPLIPKLCSCYPIGCKVRQILNKSEKMRVCSSQSQRSRVHFYSTPPHLSCKEELVPSASFPTGLANVSHPSWQMSGHGMSTGGSNGSNPDPKITSTTKMLVRQPKADILFA